MGDSVLEPIRKFIAPFTDPIFAELGGYIADRLKFVRFKNSIDVLIRAKQILEDNGFAVRPVAPKLLLPILEGAALEEESSMVELWATLLASASSNANYSTVLTFILTQLTSKEAEILEWLYNEHKRCTESKIYYDQDYAITSVSEIKDAFGIDLEDIEIIMDNLLRLRILKTSGIFDTENPYIIRLAAGISFTALGVAFMKACKFQNI